MSKALGTVQKAIKEGTLVSAKKLKCADCQAKAFCYDHRDYSKPLLVEPVCRHCNWARGPADKFRSATV